MGWAAMRNPRSRTGGKPPAYVSLHRLWRACDFFLGDHDRFAQWLDAKQLDPHDREVLEFLWRKRYPPKRVILS